jgi:hypothetical protein
MTPSRFREELKRFDKQLDFEFNGKKQQWEIVGEDRQHKKYLIKAIPLGKINTVGVETIKELYDCSPIKQGGAKRLNERIDDIIRQEEAAEEKAQADSIQERLEDAWMHYQYKEGKRVSFVNAGGDEGTLRITDRRRFHDLKD